MTETDPDEYVSTTSNTANITVLPQGSAMASFGDRRQGGITGTVFNDANGNKMQDPGESGIGNVTVELFASDSDAGAIGETVTGPSGNYSFGNVTPGTYKVRETDPDSYVSTNPNTADVTVPPGGSASANFGDRQQGGVSGVVFSDTNGNGMQDPGENGLENVTVELLDAADNTVTDTFTDGTGLYLFAGIPAGDYKVRETDPAGYVSTGSNLTEISVPPDGSASANFGDRQEGGIGGVVFNDINGNKMQDPGENGIPNAAVELLDSSGGIMTETSTDGTGAYLFVSIPAGDYRVQETDPPGYVSTSPNLADVTLPPGGSASANFGDLRQGSLGGVVFSDTNGNKIQDPGETGIGNVTVELLDDNGDVIRQTVSDDGGAYRFEDVQPGNYTVRESDPDGYESTSPNTMSVTVVPERAATANFADIPAQANPDDPRGAISGLVFDDANGNKTREPGESGLENVTVELLDENGNVVMETVTDAGGVYRFENVEPEDYTLRETDPAGYTSTGRNTVGISVLPGDTAVVSFGDRRQGSVGGVVFSDVNGDKAQDPGEQGMGNVTVELLDENGNVIAETITDPEGDYSFDNVPAGDYKVRETDPAGHTSTSPNTVDVSISGDGSATANFGDRQQGSVSGVVFNDVNADKAQDASELGIGNVTVELLDAAGDVIAETVTDATGAYSFTNVSPGDYRVRETDPAGYTSTGRNTANVTVPPNGSAIANFGDRQQGTVSGVVFSDTSGDGLVQPGESGMGNVTVELLDQNGNVIAETRTNPSGEYVFENILPGDYTVRESQPPGYVSTTDDDIPVTVSPDGSGVANFGEYQQATLSGVVFNDISGEGLRQPANPVSAM